MKKLLFWFIIILFFISCSQSPTEPERPSISISFGVYEDAFVSLIIYDQLNMVVITLVNEELSAGNHIVSWDCRNEDDQSVACGLYYCTLKTGEYENTIEILIIK
jgi:flagellar hook assembly protein FlgD